MALRVSLVVMLVERTAASGRPGRDQRRP